MSSKAEDQRRFYKTKTCRLICMICLTLTYFIVELVVGNLTKSVALVADAFHMLSDVISLIIGIVAVRFSKRHSEFNTYGWVRAEVVGANINSVFLLALCLTIVFDAIKRFIEPEPIENVNLLLIVGSVGFGINLIGLCLFHGFHGHTHGSSHGHSHHSHRHSHDSNEHSHDHGHEHGHAHAHNREQTESGIMSPTASPSTAENPCETHTSQSIAHTNVEIGCVDSENHTKKKKTSASMNMHGVFLHVMADALGSIAVIISALIIKFVPHDPDEKKHWTVYIDPTLSVVIVIIISISTVPLFRDTTSILLQTIPKHLGVDDVKVELMKKIPEIDNVHELHIWRLTDEKVIASAHLHRKSLDNYMIVAEKVKHFFHSIGIHSLTIQYEHIEDEQQTPSFLPVDTIKFDDGCLLRCRTDACQKQRCCTIRSTPSNNSLAVGNVLRNETVSDRHQHDNPIFIESIATEN